MVAVSEVNPPLTPTQEKTGSGLAISHCYITRPDPITPPNIGVYRAAELVSELFEVVQVKLVILFAVEADGTIVATLNDVPRNAGEGQAGATGHGKFAGRGKGKGKGKI